VSGESEFRVPDASEDLKALAARLNAPPTERRKKERRADAAPPERPAAPEFVLTEAMADALVQQGHSADALRIYRELARRNGGDTRLHSRIQELEAAEQQAATRPSYAAAVTKGQSVAAFFRAMVAARPPLAPGSAEPTAPAQGEDRAQDRSTLDGESTGLPPTAPVSEKKSDSAVSFDDFFNSEANAPEPPKKNSDSGKDDLDQFQSWLQNLKR
jgi:hypothetical protein